MDKKGDDNQFDLGGFSGFKYDIKGKSKGIQVGLRGDSKRQNGSVKYKYNLLGFKLQTSLNQKTIKQKISYKYLNHTFNLFSKNIYKNISLNHNYKIKMGHLQTDVYTNVTSKNFDQTIRFQNKMKEKNFESVYTFDYKLYPKLKFENINFYFEYARLSAEFNKKLSGKHRRTSIELYKYYGKSNNIGLRISYHKQLNYSLRLTHKVSDVTLKGLFDLNAKRSQFQISSQINENFSYDMYCWYPIKWNKFPFGFAFHVNF